MRRAIATWRGQPWLGPEVLAATLAMVLIEAAAITRGFGLLVIVLFATPILWLVTLACVAWSVANRRAGRSTPLALLLLVGAVPMVRPVQATWDWASVTFWSLAHHREVTAATGQDKILTGWGDWGWAGGSTFAYVIADAQDASTEPEGVERWRRRLHLDCPIVYSQRVREHLYLVETSDCPLDGISMPK
jgi:hypothetical protein